MLSLSLALALLEIPILSPTNQKRNRKEKKIPLVLDSTRPSGTEAGLTIYTISGPLPKKPQSDLFAQTCPSRMGSAARDAVQSVGAFPVIVFSILFYSFYSFLFFLVLIFDFLVSIFSN